MPDVVPVLVEAVDEVPVPLVPGVAVELPVLGMVPVVDGALAVVVPLPLGVDVLEVVVVVVGAFDVPVLLVPEPGVVVAVCWSPQAANANRDAAHINRTIMIFTFSDR